MQFVCDKTGFPLVKSNGLTLSLLPATKLQFERFLSEPLGLSSAWYEHTLTLNPRVSFRTFVNSTREGLFMTGVTFEEASSFASWLHPHGRLPIGKEWQQFAATLQQAPFTNTMQADLLSCGMSESAGALINRLITFVKPSVLADLALIRGGILEWVRARGEPGGLGAPRPSFFSNTFDPYSDMPLKHFASERSGYYGLRVLIDEENSDAN
jgi:hypothetical protein